MELDVKLIGEIKTFARVEFSVLPIKGDLLIIDARKYVVEVREINCVRRPTAEEPNFMRTIHPILHVRAIG